MIEWDWSAYDRKFSKTLAWTCINGKDVGWKYIKAISESGIVYDGMGEVIGQVETQSKDVERLDDYDLVSFKYKPIICGLYKHKEDPMMFYLIVRNHKKSFKIGLGDGYNIYGIYSNGAMVSEGTWSIVIDLESPVPYYKGYSVSILSKQLWVHKNALKVFNTEVGFVQGARILLNNKGYLPMVKKYAGDEWQIEHL